MDDIVIFNSNEKLLSNISLCLLDLDKNLKSTNISQQIFALYQIPSLVNKYPFPVFINGILTKLGSIFVDTRNYQRYHIYKSISGFYTHLKEIKVDDEIIKKFYGVIHSNDPLARSLTLRTLSCFSKSCSNRPEILSLIKDKMFAVDSNEFSSSLISICRLLTYSSTTIKSIIDQLIMLLEDTYMEFSQWCRVIDVLTFLCLKNALYLDDIIQKLFGLFDSHISEEKYLKIVKCLTRIGCSNSIATNDIFGFIVKKLILSKSYIYLFETGVRCLKSLAQKMAAFFIDDTLLVFMECLKIYPVNLILIETYYYCIKFHYNSQILLPFLMKENISDKLNSVNTKNLSELNQLLHICKMPIYLYEKRTIEKEDVNILLQIVISNGMNLKLEYFNMAFEGMEKLIQSNILNPNIVIHTLLMVLNKLISTDYKDFSIMQTMVKEILNKIRLLIKISSTFSYLLENSEELCTEICLNSTKNRLIHIFVLKILIEQSKPILNNFIIDFLMNNELIFLTYKMMIYASNSMNYELAIQLNSKLSPSLTDTNFLWLNLLKDIIVIENSMPFNSFKSIGCVRDESIVSEEKNRSISYDNLLIIEENVHKLDSILLELCNNYSNKIGNYDIVENYFNLRVKTINLSIEIFKNFLFRHKKQSKHLIDPVSKTYWSNLHEEWKSLLSKLYDCPSDERQIIENIIFSIKLILKTLDGNDFKATLTKMMLLLSKWPLPRFIFFSRKITTLKLLVVGRDAKIIECDVCSLNTTYILTVFGVLQKKNKIDVPLFKYVNVRVQDQIVPNKNTNAINKAVNVTSAMLWNKQIELSKHKKNQTFTCEIGLQWTTIGLHNIHIECSIADQLNRLWTVDCGYYDLEIKVVDSA